ncbi:MAG TPA: response regulator transcription factor [Bacteroidota bacterium]|nr:response regulator transcription factor [Bacteroidota bacterium]
MVRVFIADDHAIVRQGLRKILAEESDLEVLGEASSAEGIFQFLRNATCDVLLLDVTMPGRSGLDIIKDLKGLAPVMHILVLSMHPETQFAVRVLEAGASGYLTKESASDELVKAIRKVARGGRYVSPSLAEWLASFPTTDFKKLPHERLSEREFQVLRMIAEGATVSEIAKSLSLSVKTISTYRTRVLDKTQMRSNAELARYAVEHHLIE